MPGEKNPNQTIDDKVRFLIDALISNSHFNLLDWQSTNDEHTFRLTRTAANLRLYRREHFDPEMEDTSVTRYLEVVNDKGRVIEEYFPNTPEEFHKFDRLFGMARRSAYKTDQVLDKLIEEIDEDIPF